jgi:hypothetical protein
MERLLGRVQMLFARVLLNSMATKFLSWNFSSEFQLIYTNYHKFIHKYQIPDSDFQS